MKLIKVIFLCTMLTLMVAPLSVARGVIYAPEVSTSEYALWSKPGEAYDNGGVSFRCLRSPNIDTILWKGGVELTTGPKVKVEGKLILRVFIGHPWSNQLNDDTKLVASILVLSKPIVLCHVPYLGTNMKPDGKYFNTPLIKALSVFGGYEANWDTFEGLPSTVALAPDLQCREKTCPYVSYYNQRVPIEPYINKRVFLYGYLISATGAPTDTLPWMLEMHKICLSVHDEPARCAGHF